MAVTEVVMQCLVALLEENPVLQTADHEEVALVPQQVDHVADNRDPLEGQECPLDLQETGHEEAVPILGPREVGQEAVALAALVAIPWVVGMEAPAIVAGATVVP